MNVIWATFSSRSWIVRLRVWRIKLSLQTLSFSFSKCFVLRKRTTIQQPRHDFFQSSWGSFWEFLTNTSQYGWVCWENSWAVPEKHWKSAWRIKINNGSWEKIRKIREKPCFWWQLGSWDSNYFEKGRFLHKFTFWGDYRGSIGPT